LMRRGWKRFWRAVGEGGREGGREGEVGGVDEEAEVSMEMDSGTFDEERLEAFLACGKS